MPSHQSIPLSLTEKIRLVIGVLIILISLPFALIKNYTANKGWPFRRTVLVTILRLRILIQPFTRKALDPTTGASIKSFCTKNNLPLLGSTQIDSGPNFPPCSLHEVGVSDAPAQGSGRHLVYFHGGAYLTPLAAIGHVPFAQQLAKAARCKSIFFLEYSLAPEQPYPAQTVQAAWAMRHLLRERGISPDQIVLAGDSAGGHLVLSFLAHCVLPHKLGPDLRSSFGEGKKFKAAILLSPVVDCSKTWLSFKENDSRDFVNAGTITRILDGWKPKEDEIYADLNNEPSPGFWREQIPVDNVVVTVGEWETLRDEGVKIATLLGSDGVNERRKLIVGHKEVHVQMILDAIVRVSNVPGSSITPLLAWAWNL